MKLARIFILFFFILLQPAANAKEGLPDAPTSLVTDRTNTLSKSERIALENKLVGFDDSSSTEIAVVLINSLNGNDIADYSLRLFNNWKIGDRKLNNGVLIFVAKDDRKAWITTGRGSEAVLTDALSRRIIANEMAPRFREGNYYEGLDAATDIIMSVMRGEFPTDTYLNSKKQKSPFFPFLMFLIIIIIVIASRFGRARRYSRMNHIPFWAAWALLNAASSRSRGSWGGFSGGGGWGGGGGGGFGGFGGGSSGGGGAGGSW